MLKSRAQKRPLQQTAVWLGFALALFVLGASVYSTYLWSFIPLAVGVFVRRQWLLGLLAAGLCLSLCLFLHGSELRDFDLLGLGFLFSAGLLLRWSDDRGRQFVSLLALFALGVIAVSTGFFLFQAFQLTPEMFWSWIQAESRGNLLPLLFAEGYWPKEWMDLYPRILPLYQISFLSWFVVSIVLSFFFSGLLLRLYELPQANRRFWIDFSVWRAPDWVLVPFVLALALLAFQADHLLPQSLSWLSWGGWNLLLISLLPLMLNGLCFMGWIVPRMSFLLLFVAIFLLVVYTLPVLTLVGLADIWFDLRQKLRPRLMAKDPRDRDSEDRDRDF
jgi:hypothetical protein